MVDLLTLLAARQACFSFVFFYFSTMGALVNPPG